MSLGVIGGALRRLREATTEAARFDGDIHGTSTNDKWDAVYAIESEILRVAREMNNGGRTPGARDDAPP